MNPDQIDRLIAAVESLAESFRALAGRVGAGKPLRAAADFVAAVEKHKETAAAPATPKPRGRRGNPVLHDFHGERLTVPEIAQRTGKTAAALYGRMARGMTAEQAAASTGRARAPKLEAAKPAAPKPAKPARAPKPPPSPAPAPAVTIKAQETVLAKDAEPIVPAGLKPQVAATPPGRFEVADAPAVFSALRPGQYSDQGSAWARAVTERKA